MYILEIKDRSQKLMASLFSIWEASVKASHFFLTTEDIEKIAAYVPHALQNIPILLTISTDNGRLAGFAGVDGNKLEMLFLHPDYFRKGLGRRFIKHIIEECKVSLVDVNEQNPQAHEFYEAMGFEVFQRDELDEQGNPFPILHMRLAAAV